MVRWLVQTNLISNNQVVQFGKALLSQRIPFEEVQLTPFTDDIRILKSEGFLDRAQSLMARFTSGDRSYLFPKDFDDILIPYGSNKLVKLAYEQGLKGTFFDPSDFRLDTWLSRRSDLLNCDAEFVRIKDSHTVLQKYGTNHVFLRPVEDLKAFAGTVCKAIEWDPEDLDPNLEIAVCAPKDIATEWRFFVVNRRVISGSVYKVNGRLNIQTELDETVLRYAQILADGWLPHPTCVMDVAFARHGGFKIVEFNCFNCSGFYGHDLEKIVRAVTDTFE